MLVGEWGVLDPRCPCIVLPVPYTVSAMIEPNDTITVDFSSIELGKQEAVFANNQFTWSSENNHDLSKAEFVRRACEVTLQFLTEEEYPLQPFSLTTAGFNFPFKEKVGLGSSAAIVVAIVKALLEHHHYRDQPELLYKLGIIIHYLVQGKVGSGFDVACSAFDKALYYRRPEPTWLEQELDTTTIAELVKKPWPNLLLEAIQIPTSNSTLLVGWTGTSASTTALIKQEFTAFTQKHPAVWNTFVKRIAKVVEKTKYALQENDKQQLIAAIQENHRILKEFNNYVPVYTEKLLKIAEIAERHGSAGKLSGAGGGDCGFAVAKDTEAAELIKEAWRKAGIQCLFSL